MRIERQVVGWVVAGAVVVLLVGGVSHASAASETPLSEEPGWMVTGESESNLGQSLGAAGDVDGDGFADVIVGAPLLQSDPGRRAGTASVYHGSPSGLAQEPAWVATPSVEYEFLGDAVASAGDVNGDGYGDIVLTHGSLGEVDVYLGSAAGLGPTPSWTAPLLLGGSGVWPVVASAGDTNLDGFDDLLIGRPRWSDLTGDRGLAQLFLGSATGLAPATAWTDSGTPDVDFASSIAGACDVNGDGYMDVVVGVPGAGASGGLAVYHGPPDGLGSEPSLFVLGLQPGEGFGSAVACAGDVEGDGFDDVVVGAAGHTRGSRISGAAYLLSGSAKGIVPTPSWSDFGDGTSGSYGFSIAGGDVNADGFDDVIVGAKYHDKAYLYLGSPSGLGAAPTWREIEEDHSLFGWAVSSAGDVDGDGDADVLVGAPGGSEGGVAFLYLGQSTSAGVDTDTDGGEGGFDTGEPEAAPTEPVQGTEGCGCASNSLPAGWLLAVGVALASRRQQSEPRPGSRTR